MGKAIVFSGKFVDVLAELEAEALRCRGMTVHKYLKLKKLENTVDKQVKDIISDIEREG
jgi:hypothetical protein